jgi:hypothetical protein
MKKLFLSAAAFILSSVCFTQVRPAAVVPFTVERNCIYIYCRVNETDSLRFLFDTGAEGSVINESALSEIKIKIDGSSVNVGSNGSNEVGISKNNTLYTGALSHENVTLTVISFQTTAFDGVIGTDIMSGHVLDIDYDRRTITFYEPGTFRTPKDYEKLRLRMVNGYPAVKAKIETDGKPLKCLIGLDSGADDCLTLASPYVKQHAPEKRFREIAKASYQGSDGSVYTMSIVGLPGLMLGKWRLAQVPAALSISTEGIDATEDMSGFFGNNVLRRFNTVLDLGNRRIYLKPNGSFNESFL